MSGISIPAGEDAPAVTRAPFDLPNMMLALALGKRGLGRCWPNPAVGAVVACSESGRVISCGVTSPGGRPHAEVNALVAAGAAAHGATLYVTLEPCSHWGSTPPCADAVIAAGIARVVYGLADPDLRVQGAGLARLCAHGVEVAASALAREARWLTLGHILRVTEHRPFVQIKLAVDANGDVPAGDGSPVWVSSAETRARGHLMRAEADAILVGHGTLAADNPDLTCRLPGLAGRSPVRVILARDAAFPHPTKMFGTLDIAPVWAVCGTDAPPENIARLQAEGATCIAVAQQADGRLPLRSVLTAMAERGITRVMVEGGPTVAAAFFTAGLADEVVIFQSSKILTTPRLNVHAGLAQIAQDGHYIKVEERKFGSDQMTVYRHASHWR